MAWLGRKLKAFDQYIFDGVLIGIGKHAYIYRLVVLLFKERDKFIYTCVIPSRFFQTFLRHSYNTTFDLTNISGDEMKPFVF